MKIDIYISKTYENNTPFESRATVLHHFGKEPWVEIYIHHDAIYNFKREKGDDSDDRLSDDPVERFAQLVNHELCHASKNRFFGLITSAKLSIPRFCIYNACFTLTFFTGFMLAVFHAAIGIDKFIGECIFTIGAIALSVYYIFIWLAFYGENAAVKHEVALKNEFSGIDKELYDKVAMG